MQNYDAMFKKFTLATFPNVKLMKTALVCAVDDPRAWPQLTGRGPSELPRVAGLAAQLSAAACFFCGHKFEKKMDFEEVQMFHADYPLCGCLLPLRNEVAQATLEAAKTLMQQPVQLAPVEEEPVWKTDPARYLQGVASGEFSSAATAYTYKCSTPGCGKACAVVHGAVARDIQARRAHRTRTVCHACFQAKRGLEPRGGHGVKPSRLKPLPTLESLEIGAVKGVEA